MSFWNDVTRRKRMTPKKMLPETGKKSFFWSRPYTVWSEHDLFLSHASHFRVGPIYRFTVRCDFWCQKFHNLLFWLIQKVIWFVTKKQDPIRTVISGILEYKWCSYLYPTFTITTAAAVLWWPCTQNNLESWMFAGETKWVEWVVFMFRV